MLNDGLIIVVVVKNKLVVMPNNAITCLNMNATKITVVTIYAIIGVNNSLIMVNHPVL